MRAQSKCEPLALGTHLTLQKLMKKLGNINWNRRKESTLWLVIKAGIQNQAAPSPREKLIFVGFKLYSGRVLLHSGVLDGSSRICLLGGGGSSEEVCVLAVGRKDWGKVDGAETPAWFPENDWCCCGKHCELRLGHCWLLFPWVLIRFWEDVNPEEKVIGGDVGWAVTCDDWDGEGLNTWLPNGGGCCCCW